VSAEIHHDWHVASGGNIMQKSTTHKIFDPGDYDPHFSFSLEFSLSDYLLLSLYLVFVAPLELFFRPGRRVYGHFIGVNRYESRGVEVKVRSGFIDMVSKQ